MKVGTNRYYDGSKQVELILADCGVAITLEQARILRDKLNIALADDYDWRGSHTRYIELPGEKE